MAKNVGGRPTVITPEVITKLEQAFSIGSTDVEASLHAGISYATLKNHQNKDPKFLARKEQLKEALVLKSRLVVSKAIDDGDAHTAKWYLENKKNNEFSKVTKTELTGANGDPLSVLLNTIDGNTKGKDHE